MNAAPLLAKIADALSTVKLEAIVIGNSAAALQGAPVTTVDIDLFIKEMATNRTKIKKFAKLLEATVYRPYYPASKLFRISNDLLGIQIDIMYQAHGIKSFASLRSRATTVTFGKSSLIVASLEDVIKSKKQAGRIQDLAVIPLLEKVLHEKKN